MEYFENLGLTREPFSGSPDPDMFLGSRSQDECLRQLEIAIRLRRGLNVVLGAVGAGKTTLCRQLFRELARSGGVDPCLILDPGFADPGEFVIHLARCLGLPVASPPPSQHALMEGVKSHLFDQCVLKGRIVCLVIDEGQKLTPACLEAMRELLNYETNEFKLLQIVVFGQVELMDLLLAQPNLADRVNYLHTLAPFTYREAVTMVRERLARAAGDGPAPAGGRPRFTGPAVYLAHAQAGGYPRKIVRICHQALLAASLRGERAIGALNVLRAGAAQPPAANPARPAWRWAGPALAATAIVALVLVLAWLAPMDWQGASNRLQPGPGQPAPQGRTAPATADGQAGNGLTPLPAEPVAATPSRGNHTDSPGTPAPASAASQAAAPVAQTAEGSLDTRQAATQGPTEPPFEPGLIGRAAMAQDWPLEVRIEELYGRNDYDIQSELAKANPGVSDLAGLAPGLELAFPTIPAEPPAPRTALVSVARPASLKDGFEFVAGRDPKWPQLRLLAYAGADGRPHLEVILARTMAGPAEARKAAAQLPQALAGQARVIDSFEPGTVFYTSLPAPAPRAKAPAKRLQPGE